MPHPAGLLLFMAATLALNLTPGPDMLYVVARSVGEGRSAGVCSALGIAAGCLVHTCAVAFGLAGLLQAAPLAFDVIRFLGAGYLVYLGVRQLVARSSASSGPGLERASLGRIFRQGVITNVLNPKVALFFLAFLPQFVAPERGGVTEQLLLLGLLFNLSGTTVNLLVALGASRFGRWLNHRSTEAAVLRRATGVVFIGLGVRLAISGSR